MGHILETLAPLVLIIALGSALAHIRFLGEPFIADLNKLAFWVALPALIFTSASTESAAGLRIGGVLAVMIAATLVIALLGWLTSCALRLPFNAHGTLAQSAFRGNLAYIGVPVLANGFVPTPRLDPKHALAEAVVVMVVVMAFYNILAVVVLQASRHSQEKMSGWRTVRTVATNPLILAGVLGLIVPFSGITLPLFLHRTLKSLGDAAIPLALLCIGGSLVMVPMHGKKSGIVAAALLKIIVLPLIVYLFARFAGLDNAQRHIALIYAACPTAAASFVMARQMGGDEALASGSIALSTVLSVFSLAAALWIS